MKKQYLFLFALAMTPSFCIVASANNPDGSTQGSQEQVRRNQEYIAYARRSGRFETEAKRHGEFEFHVEADPNKLHEFYPSIGYVAPHQALRNDPKFRKLAAQEKARLWEKHTRWLDSQERAALTMERHHLLGEPYSLGN